MIPTAPITVIIPTLNAQAHLPALLASLTTSPDLIATIIISDGGSIDATLSIARAAGATLLQVPPGRGGQFRRAIAHAITHAGPGWLWLLHADSTLPPDWPAAIRPALSDPNRAHYAQLRFDSPDRTARLLEWAVRLRCSLWGLPYGDQSLLIHSDLLTAIGGMPDLALMEDVALARTLGRSRLALLDLILTTDASAYHRDGWLRRATRNLLRLAQFRLAPASIDPSDYRR